MKTDNPSVNIRLLFLKMILLLLEKSMKKKVQL